METGVVIAWVIGILLTGVCVWRYAVLYKQVIPYGFSEVPAVTFVIACMSLITDIFFRGGWRMAVVDPIAFLMRGALFFILSFCVIFVVMAVMWLLIKGLEKIWAK